MIRALRARPADEDARSLGGLDSVFGYVVDREHHDILLLGTSRMGHERLHTDDFVIALRTAFGVYARRTSSAIVYTDPTCLIDPSGETLRALSAARQRWNRAGTLASRRAALDLWQEAGRGGQRVTVLGIPRRSGYAHVMVEADYRMKQFACGSLPMPIGGCPSLFARQRARAASGRDLSRAAQHFMFVSGGSLFAHNGDVGLVLRQSVRLEPWARGVPIDPLARRFAADVTLRFHDFAANDNASAHLDVLFHMTAVARLMRYTHAPRAAGCSLEYLLHEHHVRDVGPQPPRAGIARAATWHTSGTRGEGLAIVTCIGGVRVDMMPTSRNVRRYRGRPLEPLHRAVIQSRHRDDADVPIYHNLGTLPPLPLVLDLTAPRPADSPSGLETDCNAPADPFGAAGSALQSDLCQVEARPQTRDSASLEPMGDLRRPRLLRRSRSRSERLSPKFL